MTRQVLTTAIFRDKLWHIILKLLAKVSWLRKFELMELSVKYLLAGRSASETLHALLLFDLLSLNPNFSDICPVSIVNNLLKDVLSSIQIFPDL